VLSGRDARWIPSLDLYHCHRRPRAPTRRCCSCHRRSPQSALLPCRVEEQTRLRCTPVYQDRHALPAARPSWFAESLRPPVRNESGLQCVNNNACPNRLGYFLSRVSAAGLSISTRHDTFWMRPAEGESHSTVAKASAFEQHARLPVSDTGMGREIQAPFGSTRTEASAAGAAEEPSRTTSSGYRAMTLYIGLRRGIWRSTT